MHTETRWPIPKMKLQYLVHLLSVAMMSANCDCRRAIKMLLLLLNSDNY